MSYNFIFITKTFKQSLEYNDVDMSKFVSRFNSMDIEGLKEIVNKISKVDLEEFIYLNAYILRNLDTGFECDKFKLLPLVESIDFNIKPIEEFLIEERRKISDNDVCIINNIDIKKEVDYVDYGDTIVINLNKNLFNGIIINKKKYLIEIFSQLFDSLSTNDSEINISLTKALVNLA